MNASLHPLPDSPGKRIGMLTPSSNTVLEPLTSALVAPLADQVSVHFGRFRVTQIALGGASDNQFALDPILQAADLLADAHPHVIAWNGTSASWLGFDSDDRLCQAITARTGIPASSTIVALNRLLRALGVRKLGLVTPYTPDVQDRIAANYRAIGIEVVSEAHCNISENFAFCRVPEDHIAQMCRDVAQAKPDAIAIVCTNMRGPMIAPALERELGIPILDSIAVTLWGCLGIVSINPASLAAHGRLFSVEDPMPLVFPT
jgi:maleate isomerase